MTPGPLGSRWTIPGARRTVVLGLSLSMGCSAEATPPDVPVTVDSGRVDVQIPTPLTACDPRLFEVVVADASVEGPGETYDYVINRWMVDEGAEPPASRGFFGLNIDNRSSLSRTAQQSVEDCSHGDYFSTLDPDQNVGTCRGSTYEGGHGCRGGVDNQLANIVAVIRQFTGNLPLGDVLLNGEIAAGRYAVLLRVAGVHGAPDASLNDPDVTLRVYPVAWPTFERCEGVQSPRQTYAIDDRSLRAAGDIDRPVVEIPGCIVRGRFRPREVSATGATTPMVLPLLSDARVPLHDLAMRFDLGVDGARGGNLGGTMLQSEVASSVVAASALLRVRDYVPGTALGFVDIPAVGEIGPAACERPTSMISVGLGFTALRANIQPTTVSGPIPGACGSR